LTSSGVVVPFSQGVFLSHERIGRAGDSASQRISWVNRPSSTDVSQPLSDVTAFDAFPGGFPRALPDAPRARRATRVLPRRDHRKEAIA